MNAKKGHIGADKNLYFLLYVNLKKQQKKLYFIYIL